MGVGEVRSDGAAVEHFDHKEAKTQRLMILLMTIKTMDQLLWDIDWCTGPSAGKGDRQCLLLVKEQFRAKNIYYSEAI